MIKKFIIVFLFPMLSYSQSNNTLDSLNKRYDSILYVMKQPKMKDSMDVLNILILQLQKVDSERFVLITQRRKQKK